MLILNLSIGTITPPVGTAMLTTCSVTKTKIDDFFKEIIPFYITLLLSLLLITYVPAISLVLVNWIY